MRGGLDDALDKLARRDELRRRASGESGGTPPAVTELVESIAGVVSRNPQMSVTVGVEGAGEPVLLHFAMADGVVQVTADNTVATRATEGPRHVDFEIDVEEPAEEPTPAPAEMPRASHDDQDRFGPTDFDYAEPTTAEQPFVQPRAHETPFGYETAGHAEQGNITPHPFAPTPPPQVPPQTQAQAHPYAAHQAPHPYAEYAEYSQQTQQQQPLADPEPPILEPLPEPIPLQVERPEETEQAARRLAALLRSDPGLLDNPQ
ncbi:MAG TPA: hypothetical protein VN408_23580 [Actinoplanes sp.]|nr:hypothetical protein [Actinoplanes sp.]